MAPFNEQATLELEQLAESARGLAFEVKIKRPDGALVMTAARARLEAYECEPVPCILQPNIAGIRALGGLGSQERADKAYHGSDEMLPWVERVRMLHQRSNSAKRRDLKHDLEKAEEKRECALAERSCRAGQHFEAAVAKALAFHKQQACDIAALRRKLHDAQAQKRAAHDAGVAGRGARAGLHNESVAEKLQRCQEMLYQHAKECRQRLDEAQLLKGASRKACLTERLTRAHHHNEVVAEKVHKHCEARQRCIEELQAKLLQKERHAEELRAKMLRRGQH